MVVLAMLLVTLGAFALTRALRLQDDIVNAVVLTESIRPGERAKIRFTTTEPDSRADVLVTDVEDRQVRALLLGEPLAAGPHTYEWDGLADDGDPVAEGQYGIRVILRDQGRDIKPPNRISVERGGGE